MIKELILVGLVGMTHKYGSGSVDDNLAAQKSEGEVSDPRAAALQSLALARELMRLGQTIGIMPPQIRPDVDNIRTGGFVGNADQVITQAALQNFKLLEDSSSAASMWVANAATVCPSVDSRSGRLNITTANLFIKPHRRIEATHTHRIISKVFKDPLAFKVHQPLPSTFELGDEGAANHMRVAPTHSHKGLHIFVYGRDGSPDDPKSARHALASSKRIQQLHQIPDNQAIFVKQNPQIIEHGVFHNDVIAVGNENVLFYHEHAFANGQADVERIKQAYRELNPAHELITIEVKESELSVDDAVNNSYLFNSQIVTLPDGKMAIVAATDARDNPASKAIIDRIIADPGNPITQVSYENLKQSMKGGGGPACERLRVPVTEAQIAAIRRDSHIIVNEAKLQELEACVKEYYPDRLVVRDIAKPELYHRNVAALNKIHNILGLPPIQQAVSLAA